MSRPEAEPPAPVPRPELRTTVSPGQLAAGFGIIAAVILLVLRRRRGRKG